MSKATLAGWVIHLKTYLFAEVCVMCIVLGFVEKIFNCQTSKCNSELEVMDNSEIYEFQNCTESQIPNH